MKRHSTIDLSAAASAKADSTHNSDPALEEPDEINRFTTDSEWAEDVEIASVHRVLERLRAAMKLGLAACLSQDSESADWSDGLFQRDWKICEKWLLGLDSNQQPSG